MPKLIDRSTRLQIKEKAATKPQGEVAREFNVSRMFVNAVVNDRKIRRTRRGENNRMFI